MSKQVVLLCSPEVARHPGPALNAEALSQALQAQGAEVSVLTLAQTEALCERLAAGAVSVLLRPAG